MKRLATIVLSLLCVFTFDTRADHHQLTPIGAAKIDITPDYPIRLTGYGSRREEATEVVQKLWAKALAIGADTDEPAILITVDNCGVPDAMTKKVASRLLKVGIKPEKLVIGSSHTHSAPMLPGFAPFIFSMDVPTDHQKRLDRYASELIDAMEKVALDALKARQPGKLEWAKGKVGFAHNRRTIRAGKWAGFSGNPAGPVDHDMPMLRATNAKGKPVAILIGYACHCTTIGGRYNKIWGDWAGHAQEEIEKDNPGAIGMVLIGCGGDQNPNPSGQEQLGLKHGRAIADEVKRLVAGPLNPVKAKVAAAATRVDLPFEKPPTRAEWESRAKQKGSTGYHAKKMIENLDKDGRLQTHLSYPLSAWSFGDDMAMVFLAGEVVIDYSLRLKKEMDGHRLWVNAYCNDVPCYIASKRIMPEGGYEVDSSMRYYARPTRFKPEIEDIIVKAAKTLVPESFHQPRLLSPKQFIDSVQLHGDLRMEVVAAEPLVVDPIAIDFGLDGKLWVVEQRDYPLGMDGKFKAGGVIKFLEDTDLDGKYDKATVFMKNVPFPTGVKTWRKGVIICAAPDLIYAEDTNGDGKADKREVLITGFGTNNYHTRLNQPTWGLDNWMYIAQGKNTREIKIKKTGKKTNIAGRDFKFNPDTMEVIPVGGHSQYGRVRDDWGNWFGLDNSNLLWHYPLPDRYMRRNPHIAPPSMAVYIPEDDKRARLYPIGENIMRTTALDHEGRVTSACGVSIYRDTLLGDNFVSDAFICEPAQNLVTRRKLIPKGSTFTARRAPGEETQEFMASGDNWFRPVQSKLGPDGALWIVDMYRFIIEHPRWVPKPILESGVNLRLGEDRGRIYRIYHKDRPPRNLDNFHNLKKFSGSQLMQAMDRPNGTLRDMIHQEVYERGQLEGLVPDAKHPAARVQTISALQGIGATNLEPLVTKAMRDKHPGVRRNAVRLCESLYMQTVGKVPPDFENALQQLTNDDDPQVQLQLAFYLGEWDNRGETLAKLLLKGKDDTYIRAAAISSSTKVIGNMIQHVIRNADQKVPPQLLQSLVATAIATGNHRAIGIVAKQVISSRDHEAMSAFLDALARGKKSIADIKGLNLAAFLSEARAIAINPKTNNAARVHAIKVLGRVNQYRADDAAALKKILSPQTPADVQSAAATTLARRCGTKAFEYVLSQWSAYSPQVRAALIDVCATRDALALPLLQRIDKGEIRASDIDPARRQLFTKKRSAHIRKLATKVFVATFNKDRQAVIDRYKSTLTLKGDTTRGAELFKKNCATCHKIGDIGQNVGPDLRSLTDNSPQFLLTSILDPNRAVEPKYVNYTAETADLETFAGIIAEESANSITILGPHPTKKTILRTQLESLRSTNLSMMPEGMETAFKTPQEMADMIAFVRTVGPKRKSFPGNEPALIKPAADGSLTLSATNASIHGPSIVFEPKYRNLGYWQSEQDRAVWTIDVAKAGRYNITMEWALPKIVTSNRLGLSASGNELIVRVPATGNWDTYKRQLIGTMQLKAGEQSLTMGSSGPVANAMIDLRELKLTPAP